MRVSTNWIPGEKEDKPREGMDKTTKEIFGEEGEGAVDIAPLPRRWQVHPSPSITSSATAISTAGGGNSKRTGMAIKGDGEKEKGQRVWKREREREKRSEESVRVREGRRQSIECQRDRKHSSQKVLLVKRNIP